MRSWVGLVGIVWAGCGRSALYAPCDTPADCPAPDEVTAECLDKSGRGYCTWACAVDADCAFDEDEYDRVCASFESEADLYCFPACREGEDTDGVEVTADSDGDGVCPEGYTCRSTGGGSDNRRVCFPGDG